MRPGLIAVVGGGHVGLAFAAACREPCVVLERGAPRPAADPSETDLRVFALSAGTRAFLDAIGAWERLPASRVAPVTTMAVFGDDGGRMDFPPRHGEPVAWIVEGNRLARAVEEAAVAKGVTLRHGASVEAVQAEASGARVHLKGGESLDSLLLVGADGPGSGVRSLLGLQADMVPFGQVAVVAHFACERPHGGVARQWFRGSDVLAWLPLAGERFSIVWSVPSPLAEELLSLEPAALADRVREAGGAILGDLRCESGPLGFPLSQVNVPRIVVPGAALLGDAAHGVHPLAGQGLNLGLQDAMHLAAVLADRGPLERPGDLAVLRRHERGRRADVRSMQFVTSGLNALFALDHPLARQARNAGLGLLDGLRPLRDALAARAMR